MFRGEYEPKINKGPITIDADSTLIPWAKQGETLNIGLTPFQDHGRPAFLASTIKDNRVLIAVANDLTQEESLRLTASAGKILEEILDGHTIVGTTALVSTDKSKPDMLVFTFGNPGSPTGLMLYAHIGDYHGAPVLYQDARTKIKNADKVNKVFANAGYSPSRGMKTSKRVS